MGIQNLDAWVAAQLSNAVLTPQATQNNPYLVLSGVVPPSDSVRLQMVCAFPFLALLWRKLKLSFIGDIHA